MTFSPDGANAVASRPNHIPPVIPEGWFRDVSHPGSGNGTVITASLLNSIIANLRDVVSGFGGQLIEGADDMIRKAIENAMLTKEVYDPLNIGKDAFDMANMNEADDNLIMTNEERQKVSYIVVTSYTDLDAIRQRVVELDSAVVLVGEWDASVGTFPGNGLAQPGQSWVCTTAGTVDGVSFVINDQVLAIVANASTTTYLNNWVRIAYANLDDIVAAVMAEVAVTYAPLASPALVGVPIAPTPARNDTTTTLATTAFVMDAFSGQNSQAIDYTLLLTDARKTVELTKATPTILTVPANATVPFVAGRDHVNIIQYGAGQVTITPAVGVTIRSRNGLKLAGQYAVATLHKRGTDEWVAAGDLVV